MFRTSSDLISKRFARLFHLSTHKCNDYYKILGVNKNATQQEIKSSYYKLVKKYHPDTNKDSNSAETFKKIQQAYETLSNPSTKAVYDETGGKQSTTSSNYSSGGAANSQYNRTQSNYSNDDWYQWTKAYKKGRDYDATNRTTTNTTFTHEKYRFGNDRSDDMNKLFGNFFEEFGFWKYSPFIVKASVRISLAESFAGCKKNIKLPIDGICLKCRGTGANLDSKGQHCPKCAGMGYRVVNSFPSMAISCNNCGGSGQVFSESCPSCVGSGRSSESRDVNVQIPQGVEDGGILEFSVGVQTVELTVKVDSDQRFKRIGYDLHTTVDVDVIKFLSGGKVPVKFIDGTTVELNIPKNSDSHTEIIMRNKGFPKPSFGFGNAVFTVRMVIPEDQRENITKNINQKTENDQNNYDSVKRSIVRLLKNPLAKTLVVLALLVTLLMRYG